MMPASMPPDGFADEQTGPPDGFADEATQVAPKPSIFSKVSTALRPYTNSQVGSPSQMLESVPPLLSRIAGKTGEMVTEQMGRENQRNPQILGNELAAGVGTAISMAPDVAMLAGPTPKNVPRGSIENAATRMARRSIGYLKSELTTPFARGKATDAAKIALENNVIPFTGNPETMALRANSLANKSGQELGKIRSSVGPQPIEPVFEQLQSLRSRLTEGGSRGGNWDAIHSKIDEAEETLRGLRGVDGKPQTPQLKDPIKPMFQPASEPKRVFLKSVVAAKNREGGKVNWQSDLNSQKDAKGITGSIEAGIEQILKANGVDMTAYKQQKRIFGGAKSIQKAANREIAGQEGNKIGRLSLFGTISDIASRRLPGGVARVLSETAKVGNQLNVPLAALQTVKMLTDENIARDYYEKAGKDKAKARKLAEADGWTIPRQ